MSLLEQEFDIVKAVKHLQSYMNTYDQQKGYEEYTIDTFIQDVLYGLGVSINREDYEFADGFAKLRKDLVDYLEDN